jgi:hypothetical protein
MVISLVDRLAALVGIVVQVELACGEAFANGYFWQRTIKAGAGSRTSMAVELYPFFRP